MPWTEEAVAGMRAQPATVAGAKLYDDKYATLVFDDDAEKRNNNDSKVVGWVLTTHSPRLFAQKLKQFDFIEGYNEGDPDSSFYQRRIVDVRLGNPNQARDGEAIGEEGSMVKAFVYHKEDCNKEKWIQRGDWLTR